jgi:thioredoxin reductase (NADPH)
MSQTLYDILIIGAGPAGFSAAIYGSRSQLKTIIFGDPTKGNLYKSHIIANYFGFPKAPTGPELTSLGIEQAKSFGTEHIISEIVDLKLNNDGTFTIKDDKQREYMSKTVIVATGQSYALSGIKNEKELTGKGISYCVICDGFFFKNKKVVVIGSGNYAGEEALQLLNYTKDITILSHGKELIFSDEIKEALKKSNIQTIKTVRIKEITGNNKAEKLTLMDGSEMAFEGYFMAVGVAGAVSFAKKMGLEMKNNYIKVDLDGNTNIKGLFAAGDCTGSPPQVASSVGNGCNAALSAIKLIRGLKVYIQYD